MEAGKLYTARVQVVDAMEQGFPGRRRLNSLRCRSVNQQPIGFVSGCAKEKSQHCRKAGIGTQPNYEARSESGWKRLADRLLKRRVT
jgi:hypothetical protein